MRIRIPSAHRLIAALDVPTEREALRWVKKLSPAVRVFKVGLELFCSSGPGIVKKINKAGGKVFLDLKFFDIPNTMAGAVASAIKAEPFLLNVHALAGSEALKRCAESAQEKKKTKLIAVTVLTSFDERGLREIGVSAPLERRVESLCGLALKSGLHGVVASPMETKKLRKKFGLDFLIVTPGVRPSWSAKNDQKRIATPYNAIKDGADYIVVGRPILGAEDPVKAARLIQKEIREALK